MKRELTKEERELTEKNVNKQKVKLKELNENLEYIKAQLDKQKFLRDFDDKWRGLLRRQKDDGDKAVIKQIEEVIKQTEFTITEAEKQINEGVEVKHITGVN